MLVGITGPNGAGKTTVARYLQGLGYLYRPARDVIAAELARRGMAVDRDALVGMAQDLRRADPTALIKQMMGKAGEEDRVVVESIRTVKEAQYFKSCGGVLMAVTAGPNERFDRIQARNGATDRVDRMTFDAHDERERNSQDQNLEGCMNCADFCVDNTGLYEDLLAQVRMALRITQEVPPENEYIGIARRHALSMSMDSLMPCGSVLVRNGDIVGRGANGSLHHEEHGCRRAELGCRSGEGYDLCEGCSPQNHSEATTLACARAWGHDARSCDLFLWGHYWCCDSCWTAMQRAGVRNVYLVQEAGQLFDKRRPGNIVGRQREVS